MQIKTISYSDSREYIEFGLKRWRKAGIEVGLSENDTPEEGYKYAREQVEKTLNDNPPVPYPEIDLSLPPKPTSNIPLSKEQKEQKEMDKMVAAIMQYTDPDLLVSDHKMWMGNPVVKAAIDLRKLQLKKQTT